MARREVGSGEVPETSSGIEQISDSDARVWYGMTVKLNLGNYENVELSIGESRTCPSKSARSTLNKIAAQIEPMISAKSEEVRMLWGNE